MLKPFELLMQSSSSQYSQHIFVDNAYSQELDFHRMSNVSFLIKLTYEHKTIKLNNCDNFALYLHCCDYTINLSNCHNFKIFYKSNALNTESQGPVVNMDSCYAYEIKVIDNFPDSLDSLRRI